MDRAVYLSIKDGSIRGYRYFRSEKQFSIAEQRKIVNRYKLDNYRRRLVEVKTFRDVVILLFQHARIAMLRDGYHVSLCLLLQANSVTSVIDFTHPDRASRYVIMRDLARLSTIMGADGVILITEVWTASRENVFKSGFAVDAPNRGEGILLNAVNNKGETKSLFASVQRRRFSKKVRSLSETVEDKDDVPFVLSPFMREWGCLEPEFIERGLALMESMGIGG